MSFLRFHYSSALGAAFVLSLSLASCDEKASGTAVATDEAGGSTSTGALRIGYVNADTILMNYQYLSEQSAILQERNEEASASFERKAIRFQEKVQSFSRRAQSGNMTPKSIENEQAALAREEQQLALEQQRLNEELTGEGLRIQAELAAVLKREVQAVQEEQGFDYIMQFGNGSPVLAVNEDYDVTRQVLDRMNAGGPPTLGLDSTEFGATTPLALPGQE